MKSRRPQGEAQQLPSSRSEAKAGGFARYFTGRPCVNGHLEERNTKNGHCLQCDRDRQAYRLANDAAYREKNRAWARAQGKKVRLDPVRGEIRRRQQRATDALRNRKEEKAIWNQLAEVKARRRELQRARYANKLRFDPEYKTIAAFRGSEYARANKDKMNARTAGRRFALKRASPPWLTDLDRAAMVDFYRVAQTVTKLTGVKHEVDHIFPLNGETVSGLHTPWNLQLLTRAQNRAKANLIPEAMQWQ